jgi:hypothetical protein
MRNLHSFLGLVGASGTSYLDDRDGLGRRRRIQIFALLMSATLSAGTLPAVADAIISIDATSTLPQGGGVFCRP